MKTIILLIMICQFGLAQTVINETEFGVMKMFEELDLDMEYRHSGDTLIAKEETIEVKCIFKLNRCYKAIYSTTEDPKSWYKLLKKNGYRYKSGEYLSKNEGVRMTTKETPKLAILTFVRDNSLLK